MENIQNFLIRSAKLFKLIIGLKIKIKSWQKQYH
jgi:hypothetical protein